MTRSFSGFAPTVAVSDCLLPENMKSWIWEVANAEQGDGRLVGLPIR
jgi:hypothetical protein